MPDIFISKSQFLKGLQCLKSLYLQKYYPQLAGDVSESREALFQSGKEVGYVARGLFPGGLEILFDGESFSKQLRLTKSAINKGTDTLYEAAFYQEGLFAKTDILRKCKNGWDLFEIKNSTEIKEDAFHLEDVAFQYHVLRKNGLSINKTYLVHINNQYERQGDIEVDKLFTINDTTKDAKDIQKKIKEQVKIQKNILGTQIPKIDISIAQIRMIVSFRGIVGSISLKIQYLILKAEALKNLNYTERE